MERHKLKIAVYLILIKEGQILLSRRCNTGWQDGNYSVPSGHVDPDETIESALCRETKEEIGIVLKTEEIKLVHVMHRMNIYIDFYFVCEKWEGELENKEPNKCDDLKWFNLDTLPENIIMSVKQAIGNYQKNVSFSEFNPSNER